MVTGKLNVQISMFHYFSYLAILWTKWNSAVTNRQRFLHRRANRFSGSRDVNPVWRACNCDRFQLITRYQSYKTKYSIYMLRCLGMWLFVLVSQFIFRQRTSVVSLVNCVCLAVIMFTTRLNNIKKHSFPLQSGQSKSIRVLRLFKV